ncbi:MAG TPA: TetR/AcrR family transcriptional regulator [Acidimicrobiales bacterium]
MPRVKQRTPQLRDHLLHVAVDMLASDGAARFTTRKLAAEAHTSTPAVYELFGDRAGLLREVFFEGFRLLGRRLHELEPSDDPRADLVRVADVFRLFVAENPVLAEVMFSRPFADFDPGPSELEAGSSVRELIIGRVRRCIDRGVLTGDETDIAHVVFSLAQGLAAAETTGRLGTSKASIDRRWDLALRALFDGLG